LFATIFKEGRFRFWVKIFRILVVSITILIFTYYFFSRSLNQYRENSLTVQVVNKLPFPLDFYLVKVNNGDNDSRYETRHLGNIRSSFYRIDYLDMKNSDEYWIAAYMGRKNLVYFSQHAVPNKNEDQIIEIQNYINQSVKLSEISKTLVADLKFENMKTAIWITLDLLLLFLNIALLVRKSK
jgi:hypothetical protein